MEITLIGLYNLLKDGGLPTILLFILWSGYKGYWVFGSYYDKLERELDENKDIMQKDYLVSQKATELAVQMALQLKEAAK